MAKWFFLVNGRLWDTAHTQQDADGTERRLRARFPGAFVAVRVEITEE